MNEIFFYCLVEFGLILSFNFCGVFCFLPLICTLGILTVGGTGFYSVCSIIRHY